MLPRCLPACDDAVVAGTLRRFAFSVETQSLICIEQAQTMALHCACGCGRRVRLANDSKTFEVAHPQFKAKHAVAFATR
eukprot:1332246-Rhodomonas_salina.1